MNSNSWEKDWRILLFLPIPFIFYWYTCLPGIGLGDSVLFIHAIKHLKISTWVNNHNLTALWGWPFQFLSVGDIAYRGNLSCVFSSSIAIDIFYVTVFIIHRSAITALVSTIFLMISQSVWWHATDLADYSMNTVFVASALYLYARLYQTDNTKYLFCLFFLCGFALFQHYLLGSLAVGAAAALVCRILKRKEPLWPLIWKPIVFFLVGLIPWLLTFSHDISLNHSVANTLSGCMGGPFKSLYFKQSLWKGIAQYLFIVFLQFPSLYLLPIAVGIFFFLRAWKFSESAVGIIVSFIPVFYFELFINTWAKFAQLISTFIIMAFWASFVVHWIVQQPQVRKSSPLRWALSAIAALSVGGTIYFYAHLSQWGENPQSRWYPSFNNSYTENCYRLNEFLGNPDKRNYRDIENFCKLLLKKLPRNSQYWDSDSRLFFQTKEYYQQYYFKRPDIDIEMVNSFGFPHWGADSSTFAQKLGYAYATGKNLFICCPGHPFASLLANLPYKFRKFPLDKTHWVYKLITIKDKNPADHSLWGRWDFLPDNKPVLISLTLDNVLDLHEGSIVFQQDMNSFGPFWKNDSQIYFNPDKINAEIAFLLRFHRAFTGDLTLNITTAFDAGIVQVLLNNVPLTQRPLDLYSVGVNNKNYEFRDVAFAAGNNILSLRVIGKEVRSSDMKLGIDTIKILPAQINDSTRTK